MGGKYTKYPRIAVLAKRESRLEDMFTRVANRRTMAHDSGALEAIGHAIEDVRREARMLRPQSEGELRAMELAGFLEEAPQNVAEGDNSFNLLRTSHQSRPLNFDTLGDSAATRFGIAGLSSHDDYGENSMP